MPRYIKQFSDILKADFCAELIQRFDQDPSRRDDPQPEYSRRQYINVSLRMDWMRAVQRAIQASDPMVQEFFRLPEPYRAHEVKDWAHDGWILARYAVGDSCGFHDDAQSPIPPANGLRLATLIFFLNDVPEGGELHFPAQEVRIKPRAGHAVIFPAQVTHPHEVLPTLSPRYVLQTWITDPKLWVVQENEDFESGY